MVLRVPPLGDEKSSLMAAMNRHREAIGWKVAGVSDADLRRSVLPSGLTMLGLVKHLAFVEFGWFCDTFGRDSQPVTWSEDDEDADFRIEPDEFTSDVLALYARAVEAANLALTVVPLEQVGRSWDGRKVTMRWVAIHMLEETARHAGHMDVMRELIDGATGDHDWP